MGMSGWLSKQSSLEGQVSLSIEAPDVVEVLREELINSQGYQE